ncbi:5-oxoprolinase subunit PxpB [Veillonella parvula]|uniref:5-oxoprolinase subunit PxpB n=1 Tax=Veillonella parvula TaxID=29466 RepID=UPI00241E2B34|nr:5-oxoprolinase subunit PxpB [Veillonella parvula]MBS5153110.1 5-oxoprolinase subunit PxpB [Veillonella parvula]MBS5752567.1 5-oxoprolinase subunit PxpB [Veillonella parvula]MDU6126491.1 5-oxoprolinase subunit PxpB [Veillonella sp.]
MKPTISPVGDCAISIDFGQVIDPKINRQIRQIIEQIKGLQLDGIIELVPTYCALLVQYDAMVYSYSDICRILEPTLQESVTDSANELVTIIEIPTVYGGEFGPDLGFVASHNHLSEAEVVSIHSGTDYLVYMLGFIPGFTYLGGVDPRIATPRLSSPRILIPAGSVGIAGEQTGTYPSDSPGGWQIIGRTPVTMYDMSKEQAALLQAGDYVRYVSIDENEFHRVKSLGMEYIPSIYEIESGDLRGYK